jgi:hypothetical protein
MDDWGELGDFELSDLMDDSPETDRRDSEVLVAEAAARGEKVTVLERSRRRLVKYLDYHFQRIGNVSELMDPPKPGEQYRLVTQQGFNTFTFIVWLIERFGRIDSLDVVTFNMNEGTISALMHLLDGGGIHQLRIVVSDSIKFRMPERVEQLRREFSRRRDSGRFDVCFVWNHAKIALIAIGTDRFVIEGSGNFSSNAEIEQYLFENNADVYDFHREWLNDALFGERRGARHELLLGEGRGQED